MSKAYKVDFQIKTLPHFLAAAASGEKTFTVRTNDRPYEVGKVVRGYMPGFPQVFCDFAITYVLTAAEFPQGLKPGYCVCGIKLLNASQAAAVLAAYEVIKKVEETLNFYGEQAEYYSAPKTLLTYKQWAHIWYERAAQIHELLNCNTYNGEIKETIGAEGASNENRKQQNN